jgi:pyridoxal/pyridoxine/pyridoxamine kinase
VPTFLKNANALDRCRCDCCGQIFPKAQIHEHHIIKRASGGGDTQENVICLDTSCHTAVHQVEMALRNQNRKGTAADLVSAMFPHSIAAQRKCMELAAMAAMGVGANEVMPDYAMFDTPDMVHLTPVKVSPKVKALVNRVTREMKNPKTGKKLGVADYVKGLIEADLRKRGYTF